MKKFILMMVLSPVVCFSQWVKQTSNTTEVLNNVHFVNDNIGFAVGNNGAMVKTVNGGSGWSAVATGLSSGQLLGVFFVNKDSGWICGTNGLLKKTINGGTSWTTYNTGLSTYLSGIYFTSKNVGYVAGQNGVVMKTTNGGISWDSQIVTSRNFINLYFRDSLNGYACGGSRTIIFTTDGGVSWNKMFGDSTSTPPLYSVKFLTNKIGYSVGLNGIILHTADGGSNWTNQKSGLTKSLYSVHFVDSFQGWVTCNQGDSILTTTDGGKNWLPSTLNYASGYNCVYFPSVKNGYIVGKNGAIFKLVNTVGINAPKLNDNSLLIYPNPATDGMVNIKDINDISAYRIYDMSGRVIDSKNLESKNTVFAIDVNRFVNGSYILELNYEGNLKREKLILYR